jgi:triosephosphate isomerase
MVIPMNVRLRQAIIAGNWKMNFVDMPGFFGGLGGVEIPDRVKVVLCAPFTFLSCAGGDAKRHGVNAAIGAQDISGFERGAYTGEVSGEMLRHAGAEYVIIGHSERRRHRGETDGDVAEKTLRALEHGLTPIVCVGETLEQHRLGVTREHIRIQTKAALARVGEYDARKIAVAYEPVWAIGTGETASPEDAQEVCAEIRGALRELFGDGSATAARILYGGSMNAGNAAALLSREDIDGGLVGTAALDAGDFAGIIEIAARIAAAEGE